MLSRGSQLALPRLLRPAFAASATSVRAMAAKTYKVQKSDAEWKKQLGPAGFQVLRQKGTERPGTSEYDQMMPKEGIFRCGACEHPLYTAKSKFASRCGWPCFDQVIFTEENGSHVGTVPERGAVEIVCNNCGSHLGHVFYGEGCTKNNERH
eukprot:gnl/TRDRNA2_/TRDRNA2_197597_c0_seq1.p2 gnl/TRDRNA2_/TRDRNA2_197597_c0~~gnl/TRDRNA2_/TRDRNA2_197597_c0_seq1.p2  ORF type:complete len:152 (-),score=32.74 gnl/TRDRNA2_/TRDRNA2_197597_c0_seq1:113-568(-)